MSIRKEIKSRLGVKSFREVCPNEASEPVQTYIREKQAEYLKDCEYFSQTLGYGVSDIVPYDESVGDKLSIMKLFNYDTIIRFLLIAQAYKNHYKDLCGIPYGDELFYSRVVNYGSSCVKYENKYDECIVKSYDGISVVVEKCDEYRPIGKFGRTVGECAKPHLYINENSLAQINIKGIRLSDGTHEKDIQLEFISPRNPLLIRDKTKR